MDADAMEKRFYVAKSSGSEYAYVQDRSTPVPVDRYNIFKRYGGIDGWTCANKHAEQLNAALSQEPQ